MLAHLKKVLDLSIFLTEWNSQIHWILHVEQSQLIDNGGISDLLRDLSETIILEQIDISNGLAHFLLVNRHQQVLSMLYIPLLHIVFNLFSNVLIFL